MAGGNMSYSPPFPVIQTRSEDLLAHFNRYFELVPADTAALQEDCFRLRYQVYCVEGAVTGFRAEPSTEGLERDVYDERSLHCQLRHRTTNALAGTVRLILAPPPLPVEIAGGSNTEQKYRELASLHPGRIGECSRFVLSRQFRSRAGEAGSAEGISEGGEVDRRAQPRSTSERRARSHPILGLVKACVMMSWKQGVAYWYNAMEPKLDRRLRQFALVFRTVSPMIDYHGPVQVFWGYVPDLLVYMREQQQDVWGLLTENGEIWSS